MQKLFANPKFENPLLWILFVVFVVHFSAIFNDFHTDDFLILLLMERGFDYQTFRSMENPENFRPLANIAVFLRYHLLGDSPAPWYVLNVLLHLLTVGLLFYFVKNKIGEAAAVLASLIFGIYFQHFEAVLWLYGIVRLLGAIFALLALIYFFKALDVPSTKPIILSYLFFTFGLHTVEDTILLTLFFGAYAFFAGNPSWRQRIYGLGFGAVTAIYLVIRTLAMNGPELSTGYFFIGKHVIQNAFDYTGSLILPQLDHPYVFPFMQRYVSALVPYIGAINMVAVAIALALVIYTIAKGTWFERMALFFIFVSLLPAPFLATKVISRLLYVPSIGLAMLVGSILTRSLSGSSNRIRYVVAGLLIVYFLVHAAGINLTAHVYGYNQKQVRVLLAELKALDVDWPKYDYLLFDNMPGRVRIGHALRYTFGFHKRLIDINEQTEQQPNLQEEKQKLKEAGISYVLIDFKTGSPVVIEEFAPAPDTAR